MKYFIVNLLIHVIIFAVLMFLTILFAERNRRRKTKHPLVYFFPCVFAVLAVLEMFALCGPRLLDVNNIIQDRYMNYTGILESVSFCHNSIKVDNETFYINPKADIPEVGSYIKVKYTDKAKYVMEMSAGSGTEVSIVE